MHQYIRIGGWMVGVLLLAVTATARPAHLKEGVKFYVKSGTKPEQQADTWAKARPKDAALMRELAGVPTVVWLGDFSGGVDKMIKRVLPRMRAQKALPVFVIYNIQN